MTFFGVQFFISDASLFLDFASCISNKSDLEQIKSNFTMDLFPGKKNSLVLPSLQFYYSVLL